jgi:hypothetical protein
MFCYFTSNSLIDILLMKPAQKTHLKNNLIMKFWVNVEKVQQKINMTRSHVYKSWSFFLPTKKFLTVFFSPNPSHHHNINSGTHIYQYQTPANI